MFKIRFLIALPSIVLFLTSCGYHIGAAQTRDEFIAQMKDNSFKSLKTVETTTISRPYKAVMADLQDYSAKCLNVSITTGPNYALKEVGGTMHHRANFETNKQGVNTLVYRAESGYESHRHGAPAGGIYKLVAEIQDVKSSATSITLYYLIGNGSVAEQLKLWASGEKNTCPKLR